MTTYKLPDMPDKGPLWDKNGNEWNLVPGTGRRWRSPTARYDFNWTALLRDHAPLTDVPPFPKDAKFALDSGGDVWVKQDRNWLPPHLLDRAYDELPDEYAPYRALKFWED